MSPIFPLLISAPLRGDLPPPRSAVNSILGGLIHLAALLHTGQFLAPPSGTAEMGISSAQSKILMHSFLIARSRARRKALTQMNTDAQRERIRTMTSTDLTDIRPTRTATVNDCNDLLLEGFKLAIFSLFRIGLCLIFGILGDFSVPCSLRVLVEGFVPLRFDDITCVNRFLCKKSIRFNLSPVPRFRQLVGQCA